VTININEILESRTFSTSGDEFNASRSFICYDDDEDVNAQILEVMLSSGMPSKGQSHPDAGHLYASTYTASHSEDGVGVWEVVWDYKPVVVGTGGDNPLQPDEEAEAFTGLTVESNFSIVDIYKDGMNFTYVNIDDPEREQDVAFISGGGTDPFVKLVCKDGGNPISLALPTCSITITEDIVAETVDLSGALGKSGKRNLNPWLGLDVGSVVFKGVSMNRTGVGKYSLTYNFFWDKWYHLRQVPEIGADKEIAYKSKVPSSVGASPFLNVYWRQPFKETVDFGFQPDV